MAFASPEGGIQKRFQTLYTYLAVDYGGNDDARVWSQLGHCLGHYQIWLCLPRSLDEEAFSEEGLNNHVGYLGDGKDVVGCIADDDCTLAAVGIGSHTVIDSFDEGLSLVSIAHGHRSIDK